MGRLNIGDYVPIGKALTPGEEINIFHCREGKDNDRLYIKKDYDGVILAYCHHCGKKGRYSTTDFKLPHERKVTSASNKIVLPKINYNVETWPDQANVWLMLARIRPSSIHEYGIGYIENEQRMYIPVVRDKVLLGFQTRKLFKYDPLPKYLTYHIKKDHRLYIIIQHVVPLGTITIVEDLLSGIRISKFSDVIVLFGSTFYGELCKYVLPYQKVFVFLDDDNSDIKLKQIKIKDTIEFYNSNVSIIKGQNADPKNLSDKRLRRLLC